MLSINGVNYPAGFCVTELPKICDAILGCNWLRQNKGVVDVSANRVSLQHPRCMAEQVVWTAASQPIQQCALPDPGLSSQVPAAAPATTDNLNRSCHDLAMKSAALPCNEWQTQQPAEHATHSSLQYANTVGTSVPTTHPPHQHVDDEATALVTTTAESPALPHRLSKRKAMPAHLSVTLVEMPAQKDIYGRTVVSLEDVDLGATGPQAVQHDQLRSLLHEFGDVCPPDIPPTIPPERWKLGPFRVIPLKEGTKPQRGPRFRMSPKEREELDKQTQYLLEQGWIRKSTSAWACSCIFAPKGFQGEDGLRVCQDYRRLNSVTIRNSFPIPRIDDLLDAAAGFTVCSSLDLAAGYHQIPLTEAEMPCTAFYGTSGLYEFTVMPFGCTNAPAVFQTAMQRALEGYVGKFVLVYLDDVLVFSRTPADHIEHLRLVLQRLREYKLYLRLRKCRFNRHELPYLGHILTPDGIRPDPRKVQLITDWPSPLPNIKAVEQFLGLANYFRKFIRGFGAVTAPLTRLRRKNAPFQWTSACQAAFDYVKKALTCVCPAHRS